MRPARSKASAKVDRVSFSFFYGNLATMEHADAPSGRIELTALCE